MDKGFGLYRGDGIITGKGITALQNSQDARNLLVAHFGGLENIPSSLMRADRAALVQSVDEPTFARSYDATTPGIERSMAKSVDGRCLPENVRRAYYISGRGCQAGALSRFPQNIGRAMVLFYSEQAATVYDPFAGHNSRMELCVTLGRHYIGCDISGHFMEFNQRRAHVLRQRYPNSSIELYHCDSRYVPVAKRCADFTITSPPYWDIEYYGDEPEQLGKASSYEEFLAGLQQVLKENFRVLRYGAYALWFVNDFRRKGKFHLYHVDVLRLAESVGFHVHDLLVVDLLRTMRSCFVNQIMSSKILPKRHEYGLVFRKANKRK